MKTRLTLRSLFGVAVLAFAACLTAIAQTNESTMPPPDAQDKIQGFVRTMPAFRGGVIANYTPFYAPGGQRIVLYEAKVIDSERGANMGFIDFAPTGRVLQFNTEGPTKHEQLLEKTGGRPFRMVRFGSLYTSAEDDRGSRLADLGEMPFYTFDAVTRRPIVNAGSARLSRAGKIRTSTKPAEDSIMKYTSVEAMYADLVFNYDALFLDLSRPAPTPQFLKAMWDPTSSDPGPTSGGEQPPIPSGPSSEMYEALHPQGFEFKNQIPPNSPLNPKIYYTGCGPNAMTNLFIWHDRSLWAPRLLDGHDWDIPGQPNNPYDDTAIAKLQNELRDQMGTFWVFPTNQGATWPWNMEYGFYYANKTLLNTPDYSYTWAIPYDGDSQVLAGDAIKNYGKPAIIGLDLKHYTIAYKIWHYIDGLNYFLVPDIGIGWVVGEDLFYAGAADDFLYTPFNVAGFNHGFETDLAGWHHSFATGSIDVYHRKIYAPNELSYAHFSANTNGVQRLWKTVSMPDHAVSLTFSANLFSWKSFAYIAVHAWNPSDDLGVPPSGTILAVAPYSQLGKQMYLVTPSFDAVKSPSGKVTLEIVGEPPFGQFSELFVDDIRLRPTWAKPPEPHGPCVPGKPDFQEGCPDLP